MKTQVLIVDDSEVYRIFLRQILSQEEDIEIVSVASNGRLALPRVNHYKPEIILLDYDMPEMDGLAAIPEIKKISPHSRIIMFSSHTTKGAKLTIEALERGADDFVTKPAGSLGGETGNTLKILLLEHIRAFRPRLAEKKVIPQKILEKKIFSAKRKFRFCVIGISTGGPPALRRLFQAIPATIKGSILVVQHMPAIFTAQLAERLNEECDLTIVEARDGMAPQQAHVYIAPGGMQMKLLEHGEREIIRVEESDPRELCKPSVNILFHSSLFCARDTLAVIMTGMGEDGYLGMKALSQHGAYLMAQEESDCVIYGMPQKPVRDGLVDEIHAVEGLAKRITEYLS